MIKNYKIRMVSFKTDKEGTLYNPALTELAFLNHGNIFHCLTDSTPGKAAIKQCKQIIK